MRIIITAASWEKRNVEFQILVFRNFCSHWDYCGAIYGYRTRMGIRTCQKVDLRKTKTKKQMWQHRYHPGTIAWSHYSFLQTIALWYLYPMQVQWFVSNSKKFLTGIGTYIRERAFWNPSCPIRHTLAPWWYHLRYDTTLSQNLAKILCWCPLSKIQSTWLNSSDLT